MGTGMNAGGIFNRKRIGHITPSSNTALEPLTAMMTAPLAEVIANHFTRITVTAISLDQRMTSQFDLATMLAAANLLNDGAMDAILWNGTSACWNGIEADIAMCAAITAETGVPASTATLAQLDLFARYGIERFGLAVPYLTDVTERAIATYRSAGYEAVSHANLGLTINRSFAAVPLDRIRQLIRDADSPDAQCIAVICTNFPAALVVEEMEQELGKPIFDSVAVTFWKALDLVGVHTPIAGWGTVLHNRIPTASVDAPVSSPVRESPRRR